MATRGEHDGSADATLYHPLVLRIKGLRVLVVGGGGVGSRRAILLAEKGAEVKVVSLEFSPELDNAKKLYGVELIEGGIDKAREYLDWASMLIIAVPWSGEAEDLAREALRKGKLVNTAPEGRLGNVIFPFAEDLSGLIVAITSLGVSGLAARRALEKVIEVLKNDPEIACLYETHGRLKLRMKKSIQDPTIRMRIHMALWQDVEYRRLCASGLLGEAWRRALEVARDIAGREV
ncbi:MAG: hypothetical protein F7B20_04945 [Aeropyrum sp.]|nr:hypothetical protein [Aeropyrum sp.]